jgi:hypothetical protein
MIHKLFSRSLTAAIIVAVSGCASGGQPGSVVQKMKYDQWDDAYRLTNGQYELVVVPQIGRIMRYGPVGGPNMLWTQANAEKTADAKGGWVNYGGEKMWPWPQDPPDGWEKYTGEGWPPPAPFDHQPYEVREVQADSITIASQLSPQYGVRFVRTIRLAPIGSQVTLENRFEGEGKTGVAVGLWTIAQVPAPQNGRVVGLLSRGVSEADAQRTLDAHKWTGPKNVENSVVVLDRTRTKAEKVMFDGTALAVANHGYIFVIQSHGQGPGDSDPNTRAQVYTDADRDSGGFAYVELEFTSPKAEPGQLNRTILRQTWSVHRQDGQSLIEFVTSLPPEAR